MQHDNKDEYHIIRKIVVDRGCYVGDMDGETANYTPDVKVLRVQAFDGRELPLDVDLVFMRNGAFVGVMIPTTTSLAEFIAQNRDSVAFKN